MECFGNGSLNDKVCVVVTYQKQGLFQIIAVDSKIPPFNEDFR